MAQLVVQRSIMRDGRYRYDLPGDTGQGRVIHAKIAVGRLAQVAKVDGDPSNPVSMLVTLRRGADATSLDGAVQAAIQHGLNSTDYMVVVG